MINEVNDKFIMDEISGVYNRQYIDERLPVDINNLVNEFAFNYSEMIRNI